MGQSHLINVERATQLKAAGMSWRNIGVRLAADQNRKMAYQGNSIRRAVIKHNRKAAPEGAAPSSLRRP